MHKGFRFAMLSLSLLASSAVFAGDCTKTVMGGGCTTEIDQGVAAHMRGSAKQTAMNTPKTTQTPTKPQKISVAASQKH